MWNRVVGQIGQAWNQGFQGAEGSDEAGVSSTQDSGEVIESDLSPEQYLQIINSKQVELSSLRAKYETIYNKCKTLQSSYETDILAERSVIEALKVEIQERDKEQTENDAKAEDKFSRLKQQARARIQELSKEIDVIKRGQEGDGSSTAANALEVIVDDTFGASPSSSRTGTPDRLQQEAYEKERELEDLKRENFGLSGEKSELETNISQLEEQLSQLQPIKNELKASLASYNLVEQENAQLHSSIQGAAVKNSLLESRINEVIEERKECEDNLALFKKSKLKEFQEVIRSKSEEIEALNNSLSLLRLEYGEERTGREQLGTQVASLKEGKELSKQRYQQLVLQVEGYTREIEELRSAPETESSEDACKQSNSETVIRGLEEDVNELKLKLQDSDREVEQNRVDILSKDSELRRLEANLEEFQRRIEETTEEMRQNTLMLNTRTAESDRLTALHDEQAELVSELRLKLEETASQISQHQAELRAVTQELTRQGTVCREMEEVVSKALASEGKLQEKADKSEQETESLRSRLEIALRELEERNEEIEGRFGQAEARLRDLDIDGGKMESSGDLCRQLEEQNSVLSLEIEKVSKELASMTQSNSSLSKVKQNLEEGLSISQSQTEAQKSQIGELTNSKEKLLNEKTKIEAELRSISTQLEESRNLSFENKALREEAELLKEENRVSENQRESLEAEIEQLSGQLHDKDSENGRLTSDMKEFTQKQLALERDVSEREEKISSLEVELGILSGKVSGVQETEQALLVTERERSSHAQRVSLLEAELRGREGERVELEVLRETGASSQQLKGIQEELQQKVSDRDSALEKLSSENKQIKDALDKSTQSVNQMRLNLDSANRDNNKLTNDAGKISREKAQLASDLSTFEDELSLLRNQLLVKESETNSLLKTTETTSTEMSLLHSNLSLRDGECRHLRERNALLGDDAKRMQEGFDSALELMQEKLKKSESRRSELESVREESELAAAHTREERARAETLAVELQEKLKLLEEHQTMQVKLQSENQRLTDLTAEHSSQLESSRCEADGLQQENAVLRAAQENSFSGAHDQELRSLQLSQEMALLSRENEQHARKLNQVSKLLEVTEFERDQLREENTNVRDSTTQLQSLQIQFQQMTFERSSLKERFEALDRERDNLLQENSQLQSLQLSRQDAPSPAQTEVPAATSYYVAQLEERLQNVGYSHAKDLQRLSDMLEIEKHKSSQIEEAMRTARPSDGLPLPATSISEDFSCLNQPTLDECLKVLKHKFTRWKNNPKITMIRFFKSRPIPQLVLIAYFVCLHLFLLIYLF